MRTKRYKYMHTLSDKPAYYYPGEQICFAVMTRPIPLADSLAQIKRERRASEQWRLSKGYSIKVGDYGHMKVAV